MQFAVTLGLLVVVLPWSDAMKDCKKPNPVPFVDDYFCGGQKTLTFALHSDCTNCEEGDVKWRPFQGRSVPTTVCYKMHGEMYGKPFSANFECNYSVSGRGGCVLLPGNSAQTPFAGDHVVTKTDNKTYLAGVTCVFGYDEFFWVVTNEDRSADEKFKKKMLKHFKSIGFETTKLVDKDGPLVFKTMDYQKDKC